MRRTVVRWSVAVAVCGGLCVSAAGATEVRFFRQQSRGDFIAGDFDGLAMDADGALRRARRFERLVAIEEPYLFAAARSSDGWVLGTGSAGRLLRVGTDGDVETLADFEEPAVFALWAEDDGTVFAATSPDGKVYAIRDGRVETVFDPEETYIWALARAPWGDLLVATGDAARLYAVEDDGEVRLLYDSDEAHLRALHPLGDSVLIGTVGDGLVLSIDGDERIRTLYDAEQSEVLAFADDPLGGWYAAAVASEASPTQQARESSTANDDGEESSDGTVTIEVTTGKASSASGESRSEILRGGPSGEVRSVAVLARETVYSLGWVDDRLWIGTGVEGNVYALVDGRLSFEAGLDDRQVIAVLGDEIPLLATTNAAGLHRPGPDDGGTGSYVSDVLDAGSMARFGTLRWRGESERPEAVRFAVRSGASSRPDATWSAWSPAVAGREVDLAGVPPGRFVQWRVEMEPGAGESARVTTVELSYRQNNGEPVIESFLAMDPGQVLVPASFNAGDQVYEPAHPDRQGIFTTLEPAPSNSDGRLKTLWRKGYLTLRWEATDPNDDALEVELAFRPDGSSGGWLPMAERLEEDYYSFDATVLPDGVHRFRLRVSDRPDNNEETALTGEEISAPVIVDHSPPELRRLTRREGGLAAEIEDLLSPIRSAEVSIDAGEWRQLAAVDGLLDGQREKLEIDVPEGAELVLLRVVDAAFNGTTFDLRKERQ